MASNNLNSDSAIGSMFDDIAPRYDFLNHLLSFGVDRSWRRKVVKVISETYRNPLILDVATGTCDLAIEAMKLDPVHITGIDISPRMLDLGREKIRRKKLEQKIDLVQAESEKIPFSDGSFDVAMVAFGVRNFRDRQKGLSEMNRVLAANGMIIVLEFSRPEHFPFRQMYFFYFRVLLPLIGRLFSGNREAYRYLPESVMQFPDYEQFMDLLKDAGFPSVRCIRLTGGIACIYAGMKTAKQ